MNGTSTQCQTTISRTERAFLAFFNSKHTQCKYGRFKGWMNSHLLLALGSPLSLSLSLPLPLSHTHTHSLQLYCIQRMNKLQIMCCVPCEIGKSDRKKNEMKQRKCSIQKRSRRRNGKEFGRESKIGVQLKNVKCHRNSHIALDAFVTLQFYPMQRAQRRTGIVFVVLTYYDKNAPYLRINSFSKLSLFVLLLLLLLAFLVFFLRRRISCKPEI